MAANQRGTMPPIYYEVKISAEDQAQADTILNSLIEQRLVTGGQFLLTPVRFWWDGEVVDMAQYVTITSYTTDRHKDAIMADVSRTSLEEVPMVTFVAISDLGPELRDWIDHFLLQ
jgi:uncharacterized protein involved in tolerance to divalent cations